VKSLFDEDITAETDKDIGMVTTAIGFSLSFFLALYKYEVGHKLQSLTITAGDKIVASSSNAFFDLNPLSLPILPIHLVKLEN
jgi:hypothetical protein